MFSPDQLRAALLQQMQGQTDPKAAAPKSPSGGMGVGPYAALVGGEAADIGTTLAAIKRGGRNRIPCLATSGRRQWWERLGRLARSR
jgi:hypothetical protein